MGADNNIIESDDRRQETNGQDYRTRREAGGDKSQTKDVRLARPPITVKQRRGALPINVARPMDACGNDLGHRCKVELSIAPARAGKFFLSFARLDCESLREPIVAY